MQILTVISTVDDLNYPEKTDTYYIVNAPYVFTACWKVFFRQLYCLSILAIAPVWACGVLLSEWMACAVSSIVPGPEWQAHQCLVCNLDVGCKTNAPGENKAKGSSSERVRTRGSLKGMGTLMVWDHVSSLILICGSHVAEAFCWFCRICYSMLLFRVIR